LGHHTIIRCHHLGDYAGTVILISHDRDFLDRVVNAVIVPEGEGRWIEYAGGYSDMLAQRGADIAARTAPATKKPAASDKTEAQAATPQPAKAARRRLSFNEKHALETLPKRIAVLQTEIARLQDKLADPALYSRDPASFARTTEALGAAQTELAQAEEKWLELEILREEIESG
jgi:ATP-binding cassette subfamily F protein uup